MHARRFGVILSELGGLLLVNCKPQRREAIMAFVPPPLYINWVKRSLNRLLDAELAIDGAPDEKYRTAVKGFQAYEGITDDGKVGPITQNHLIRANCRIADYVDWVRGVLRDTLPLPTVGSGRTMESKDSEGIRLFQQMYGVMVGGLKADGWVGAQTEMVMTMLTESRPPRTIDYVFGDHPVIGDKPVKDEEIQALVWGLIGRKPGSTPWTKVVVMAGKFASAVNSIRSPTTVMPFTPFDLMHALGDPDDAMFEIDAMKGVSYAIMDRATGTPRSSDDLKTTDLYGGTSAGLKRKDGFEKGYLEMQRRLIHSKIRTTPALKRAFEDLGRVPDKRRALKNIYDALFAVFWNRGALGGGHANITRGNNRHCKFDYETIKVRCGPRADLLR